MVKFEVRAEFLNNIYSSFGFQGLKVQLILFTYSQKITEKHSGLNADLSIIKASGTYNYHKALKG
jgi:hypothetical protein